MSMSRKPETVVTDATATTRRTLLGSAAAGAGIASLPLALPDGALAAPADLVPRATVTVRVQGLYTADHMHFSDEGLMD
jgi:hypothetical protein